ncbi:transmembrane protease serine 6 [Drosophila biarmipes]|uniref:transmembrane protease serine 6 n=1 Tax=Drosophila biarmipes TaxID=125945 RepID=UPI0007E890F4|nr:transmembrane protease serine 6 [Drosophila biarmipes]
MKLLIILIGLLCGLSCGLNEKRIRPNQGDLFEWIGSIFLPPVTTTTTSTPVVSTSLTTTRRTTTSTTTTTTTPRPTAPNFPVDRDCVTCRCGLINTLYKIVGGQETRVHEYPWMAVILIYGRFYCSGSLINDLYVLTAAHCVEGVPPELITLRFLEHNRSNTNEDIAVQRPVSRVKVHELYNPQSFDNDLAILRLSQPVDMEHHRVRPICLPIHAYSFDHELAIVTGWGAQKEGGPGSDTLREVQVEVLPQSDCRNSTSYKPGQITDNMMCAGNISQGGKDACSGDSGGPLHATFDEQPGQYQLAGIVSWGVGCARPQAPGVYTRVNQYLRWLATNTPGACHCMPYPEEDY